MSSRSALVSFFVVPTFVVGTTKASDGLATCKNGQMDSLRGEKNLSNRLRKYDLSLFQSIGSKTLRKTKILNLGQFLHILDRHETVHAPFLHVPRPVLTLVLPTLKKGTGKNDTRRLRKHTHTFYHTSKRAKIFLRHCF